MIEDGGVSLYCVAPCANRSMHALVSFAAERGRKAGWIYAIAGWSGSAMEIGIGQNPGHVAPGCVLFSGTAVLVVRI